MAEYRVAGLARGSGFVIQGLGGQAVPQYNLVYLSGVDLWSLADADAAATMPVVGLAVEPLSLNQFGRILLRGVVNNNTWTWVAGGEIYASTVAGGLTQTAPGGVGDVPQQVGMAITATKIIFDPDTGGDSQDARIATGTYTGDGVAAPGGQAVIGVGFRPRHLHIAVDPDGDDVAGTMHWTNDVATAGGSIRVFNACREFAGMIISLDTDGFTVGDYGTNASPNRLDEPYIYTAWG